MCAQAGGTARLPYSGGYFDRARELYEQLAQWDMVAIVIAEKAMGAVQCGVAHALQTALKQLDEAETYQQEANGQAAATIAHYRAVVYDRLGEKAHAFEYFTRAYDLLQHQPCTSRECAG